ncbi:MAG: MFS transporter [Chthoniobacterales bacterium]
MKTDPSQNNSSESKPKTWSVGTLVYSSGGIVSLFALLIWGDFAWGMRDRSVAPMSQWFLNHLNVPNLLFGILISSFPAALTLIIGPIVSVKSDRYRSKRGRRIPFLLITTPIAAFGMIGLAFTPILAKWAHGFFSSPSVTQTLTAWGPLGERIDTILQNEMIVSVICFGIFWAAFEFATVIGQAVFGGLINDVVPKELLGRFFGLFRAVSLLDGIFFNYWLMGKVPDHFTLILTIIGIFYGLAFTWVCLKVKEGEYPPPPEETIKAHNALGNFFGEVKTYARECFTNSYYISIFIMLMAAGLCFVPINTFAIPYANSLNVNMDTFGKMLALTYTISLCLAFFLGWLADLFHPLRMAIFTLIAYVGVTICGSLFATTASSFLALWVAHGVLSGCYFTVAASIAQRLYPQMKFAQFASAGAIFASFGNMFLSPFVGVLIDQSGGVYRYTFVIGGALAVLALLASIYVYIRFMRLGGPKDYVAPEV